MPMIRLSNLYLFFILTFVFLFSPATGFADPAKHEYLDADTCYKRLRNSSSKKKKAHEWLKCIKKYENIYKTHPESPWAPAGMYKAAGLYTTLSKLSGKKLYREQAIDLLTRIQRRYPDSAYAMRANSLIKNSPVLSKLKQPKVKLLLSRKKRTRNNALIKKFNFEQERLEKEKATLEYAQKQKTVIVKDDTDPEDDIQKIIGDSTITELRFWSNPEYTRIVINADKDRSFSHRLLNRDPNIDKPFQRLYIDIEDSRLGNNVSTKTPINDNLLKQARAGQFLPHTVRVVIDIKSFENYKIFSLKDPFRIVIDVWGKGSNGSPVQIASPTPSQDPKVTAKPGKTDQISTDNLESTDIARQLALGVRKVVIDPGHGGTDPGAPGYFKNVWEKDIVLKIAKKLAANLRNRLKCTVLLTRSTDKKLTLEERTAIANTQKADIFISLHCNAARNKRLAGIETYILNLATDEQAIAVAARENATSEKNISDLEYILTDLMKHAKIEESTRLADVVHSSFVKGMKKQYSRINDLGVKRAPFYVLLGARMPSILIETSFLSNKKECKRLMTDGYQSALANNIAIGIEKYVKATNPRHLSSL